MRTRDPLLRRSAQEIIASFPSHIAIDGRAFGPHMPPILIVQPGEVGYWPANPRLGDTLDAVQHRLCDIFGTRLATPAEREAASIGSLMGWGVPGADPQNHVEE
jgi:hypothetical protein